jgi:hypothetical protein
MLTVGVLPEFTEYELCSSEKSSTESDPFAIATNITRTVETPSGTKNVSVYFDHLPVLECACFSWYESPVP